MQLQDVGLQGLDDVAERCIVGIDREGYFYGAALYPAAKLARRLQAQMPGRRRKEHESHHVGAGIQRDVKRLARGQAANFDDQGHVPGARVGAVTMKRKSDALVARVLQRRALLVSPGGAILAALQGSRKPLR